MKDFYDILAIVGILLLGVAPAIALSIILLFEAIKGILAIGMLGHAFLIVLWIGLFVASAIRVRRDP